MQVAVQTWSLRDYKPDEALRRIAKLGVKAIEPHWWPEDIGKIEDWRGLKLAAWGVPPLRLENDLLFWTAHKLEIPIIAVDPLPGSLAVAAQAREYGLRLAIHPHGPGHRFPGWRSVHAVIHDTPALGICLDIGHITRFGEDVLQGIRVLGSQIFSVHLKDLDHNHKDVPLGQGTIPIADILRSLKERAPDCVLSIEWEGDKPVPVTALEQGLQFLAMLNIYP